MRAFLLLCLATAGLSGFTSVARADDCNRNDETQMGLNICAGADYKAADDKLNAAYGEIMKRLADDQEARKLLQTAQRAWIGFRDAECNFATDDSKDGSIYPMLQANCLQAQTEDRLKQLSTYLNCQDGDMSCPVPAAQ